jgi:hypothetical protein
MNDGQRDQVLREIYYDPNHPAGFGGVGKLLRAVAGLGINKAQVLDWLTNQPAYTLHKTARKSGYRTRTYHTSGVDHQWQADLVDMQVEARHNEGYKYILTVIDIFSRYAWAQPCKTKSPKDVKPAFDVIFAEGGRKPFKIQTDQGLEFESGTMQEYWQSKGIKQFSVKSPYKAALVERFNGTLKKKMWTYFTHANTRKWLDVLPKLVHAYNKSTHRMIGQSPEELSRETADGVREAEIPQWLDVNMRTTVVDKSNIKVGDHVRLSKVKGVFAKGYLPSWTEEVFTISRIINKHPIQFKVKDYAGVEIDGSFYKEEVQVVAEPELYRIENIIRTRKVAGKKQYFVKWLGYPDNFNSWVGEEAVQRLDTSG